MVKLQERLFKYFTNLFTQIIQVTIKSRIKKYGMFFANSSSFIFVVFTCFIVIVFSLQTLLLVILIGSNFIKK